MRFSISLLILLSTLSLSANTNEIRFGPEFTFSKYNMSEVSLFSYIKLLDDHLIEGQPEGQKFRTSRDYHKRFHSPNKWSFEPKTDRGVIEVTMVPMTVSDFEKYASDIQDAVFVSAINTGHYAMDYLGGGHISIDFNYFKNKPLLFRNFIVDLINHNELAMGVFNYDTNNALPYPLTRSDFIEHLTVALKEIDALIQTSDFKDSYELSTHFRRIFYIDDPFLETWQQSARAKYTAINLCHIDPNFQERARIEIRSIRPQKDIYTFIKQIRLLSGRIQFLEKMTTPLPLQLMVPIAEPLDPIGVHKLTPPVDAVLAMRAFYNYLSEAGEKWSDHRDYIWPDWIQSGALIEFENSDWFTEQQSRRQEQTACSETLLN